VVRLLYKTNQPLPFPLCRPHAGRQEERRRRARSPSAV